MTAFKIEEVMHEAGEGIRIVMIAGEMTILNASEIRMALLRALDAADRVGINIEAVREVDLTGLQLICSAHGTAMAMNKTFFVEGSCSDAFCSAARNAGFYRHVGCANDVTRTCVWVGGNE